MPTRSPCTRPWRGGGRWDNWGTGELGNWGNWGTGELGNWGTPKRRAETPPRDPQQIIDDQAREIERLREDPQPAPFRAGRAVQLGPHSVAFAVLLNKRFSLPYGTIADLLRGRSDSSSPAAAWSRRSSGRRARRSRRMRPCATRCAGVAWSRSMKPAGASTRTCSGSGRMRRPSTPSTPSAAWRRRCESSGPTMPGAAAGRVAIVSVFQGGAASDLPGVRLRRCRVLLLDYPGHPFVHAVKAVLQAALAPATPLAAATSPRMGSRSRVASTRSDSAACWHAPPVGASRRTRAATRTSSPAKCAAAGAAPPAAPTLNKSLPVSCVRPISAASMPPLCS